MDKHRKLSFSSSESDQSCNSTPDKTTSPLREESKDQIDESCNLSKPAKIAQKSISYDLESSPIEDKRAIMNAGSFFDKENTNTQNGIKTTQKQGTSYCDDLFSQKLNIGSLFGDNKTKPQNQMDMIFTFEEPV